MMKPTCAIAILCLSVLLLSNSSCKKEKADSEGFSAQVDGKKWDAKSTDFKQGPYEAHLTRGDSLLSITARNDNSSITIFLLNYLENKKITPGQYTLNNSNTLRGGSYYNDLTSEDYRTTPNNTGVITIKEINTESKRIIGTFFFNGQNAKTNKVVTVTDGTFNIGYVNY